MKLEQRYGRLTEVDTTIILFDSGWIEVFHGPSSLQNSARCLAFEGYIKMSNEPVTRTLKASNRQRGASLVEATIKVGASLNWTFAEPRPMRSGGHKRVDLNETIDLLKKGGKRILSFFSFWR